MAKTPEDIDDAISEFGWRNVVAGVPWNGEPPCNHEWVENVDDEGQLIEPASDICIHCGEHR